MLGRHPEFFAHTVAVHNAVVHGVDQGNMLIDQLRHILVASGDDHWPFGRGCLHCKGADHIVGLDAGNRQ